MIIIDEKINAEIREIVVRRFLNYTKINTQSDDTTDTIPSSRNQFDLAKYLVSELKELGVVNAELDDFCYVYASLPASENVSAPSITFCAHMDTSPDVSGENVKAIVREYQGIPLSYPDDENLFLDKQICPDLEKFINQKIITASGKTLLGADDKAGIAEIMTAIEFLIKYPEIKRPEIKIIFTPDEEVGRGTAKIDMSKTGKFGYTLDGSIMGELESECFDAWSVRLKFFGKNMHPGFAKNKMVNACTIASRFISFLPEFETPERTEKREGFFHVNSFHGDESYAEVSMILRDFDSEKNRQRIEFINQLIHTFKLRYSGLKVESEIKESYKNMCEIIKNYPEVIQKLVVAIEKTGIKPVLNAIRGGTDGARLSYLGMPCPNIYTGGMLFHSKLEWIPVIALENACKTILFLCEEWAK